MKFGKKFGKPSLVWCFEDDPANPGGGGNPPADPPQSIKIGEKEYNAETIQRLEAAAKIGDVVNSTATRYGIPADQFLNYSEGALTVAAELRTKGLLTDDGELKIPEPSKAMPPGTPPVQAKSGSVDEIAALVLDKIGGRLKMLEDGTSNLYRGRVEDTLKGKHPGFQDDDIAHCVREATRTKRPLLEVAEERAKSNESRERALEEKITKGLAEKYGLDFEQLNKVKELSADGGITPAKVTGGKRLSFNSGKDTISPKQALTDFLKLKDQVS